MKKKRRKEQKWDEINEDKIQSFLRKNRVQNFLVFIFKSYKTMCC